MDTFRARPHQGSSGRAGVRSSGMARGSRWARLLRCGSRENLRRRSGDHVPLPGALDGRRSLAFRATSASATTSREPPRRGSRARAPGCRCRSSPRSRSRSFSFGHRDARRLHEDGATWQITLTPTSHAIRRLRGEPSQHAEHSFHSADAGVTQTPDAEVLRSDGLAAQAADGVGRGVRDDLPVAPSSEDAWRRGWSKEKERDAGGAGWSGAGSRGAGAGASFVGARDVSRTLMYAREARDASVRAL